MIWTINKSYFDWKYEVITIYKILKPKRYVKNVNFDHGKGGKKIPKLKRKF